MSLIEWSKEKFATNVSAHDAEHQEIFRKVNALGDAVGSGNRDAVGKALDALIATVAEHFASEEANFSKFGYPATRIRRPTSRSTTSSLRPASTCKRNSTPARLRSRARRRLSSSAG